MSGEATPTRESKTITWKSAVLSALVLAVSAGVLVYHARVYFPFIADDALISLRYAQRLLEGHGLTWTEGPRVEGYSNLLWILLVAFLGLFNVDLIASARFWGFVCNAAAAGAFLWAYRPVSIARAMPALTGALVLVLSGPIAVWTIGGLEQPLVTVLLAWALVLTFPLLQCKEVTWRQVLPASACFGLLCLTRPDSPLFAAVAAGVIVAANRFARRAWIVALQLCVVPVLCVVGQLLFRIVYYRAWVPNTALVKVSPSQRHFEQGLDYIANGFNAMSPVSYGALVIVALAFLAWPWVSAPRKKRLALLFLTGAVWAAYVAAVGGDIFPAWRHFTPIIVVSALIFAEAVHGLVNKYERPPWLVPIATAVAVALVLTPYHRWQRDDRQNQRAIGERWEWKGQVIGLMLKKGFGGKQPLLAVTAAGCLPYWSELPCLDMLGLNDYYLPRHPPPDRHNRSIAHGLGDGDYVLRRRPDLIMYGTGHLKASFRSGRQMEQRPDYHRLYTPVVFEGRIPETQRATIWVRRTSPKIGIKRTPERVDVPAYLFNGHRATFAYLDEAGEFVVPVTKHAPAILPRLEVGPGAWTIDGESDAALTVRIQSGGPAGRTIYTGNLPGKVSVPGQRAVALAVTVHPKDASRAELRSLTLRCKDGAH